MEWYTFTFGLVVGMFLGFSMARGRTASDLFQSIARRMDLVKEGQIAEFSLTFSRGKIEDDVSILFDDPDDDGESWKRN